VIDRVADGPFGQGVGEHRVVDVDQMVGNDLYFARINLSTRPGLANCRTCRGS
jgi:hypothetical protein